MADILQTISNLFSWGETIFDENLTKLVSIGPINTMIAFG